MDIVPKHLIRNCASPRNRTRMHFNKIIAPINNENQFLRDDWRSEKRREMRKWMSLRLNFTIATLLAHANYIIFVVARPSTKSFEMLKIVRNCDNRTNDARFNRIICICICLCRPPATGDQPKKMKIDSFFLVTLVTVQLHGYRSVQVRTECPVVTLYNIPFDFDDQSALCECERVCVWFSMAGAWPMSM